MYVKFVVASLATAQPPSQFVVNEESLSGSRSGTIPDPAQARLFSSEQRSDRDGSLWIGTTKGLVHGRGTSFETFTTRDGLASDAITTLFEDRAGVLWVGTSGGLSRRSGDRFDHLTRREGLNHSSVAALAGDREGSLWVGTNGGGVTQLTDRSFSTLSEQAAAVPG